MNKLIILLLSLILLLSNKSTDGFINLNEKTFSDMLIYKCPVKPDVMRPEQTDTSILISKEKTIQKFMMQNEILWSNELKIFHQISYYMNIGEYIFSFASMAPIEKLFEYSNKTEVNNRTAIMSSKTDPIDLDKIESEEFKQLRNVSSNQKSRVLEVKNDAFLNNQIYKCLGRKIGLPELFSYFSDVPFNSSTVNETNPQYFHTSYIILKATDQTNKYAAGDTIFSNESYGYLETINHIDEILTSDEKKLMIETELLQCGSDISSLVNIIKTDKLDPVRSELDCSAGENLNMYVMDLSYESLNLKSKNELINKIMPGRKSSSFGLKILRINKIGGYIAIEGLPLNELEKFNKLKDYNVNIDKHYSYTFSKTYGYDAAYNGEKI